MPELFFARRPVLRGTRRPELCGDFFGERRAPKTKTPRTTCERSSPGQADARAKAVQISEDAASQNRRMTRCEATPPCTAAGFSADVAALLNPTTPPHGAGRSRASSCLTPARSRKRRPGRPGSMKAPGPRACAGFFAQETAPVRKAPRNAARQRRQRPLPADAALPVFMKKDGTGPAAPHGHGRAKSDAFAHGTKPAFMNGAIPAFAHGAAPAAPAPRGLGKTTPSRALCPGRRFFRYLPSYSQSISPVLSVP